MAKFYRVENKKFKFGETDHYLGIWVDRERRYAFFTESVMKKAFLRGQTQPELVEDLQYQIAMDEDLELVREKAANPARWWQLWK